MTETLTNDDDDDFDESGDDDNDDDNDNDDDDENEDEDDDNEEKMMMIMMRKRWIQMNLTFLRRGWDLGRTPCIVIGFLLTVCGILSSKQISPVHHTFFSQFVVRNLKS